MTDVLEFLSSQTSWYFTALSQRQVSVNGTLGTLLEFDGQLRSNRIIPSQDRFELLIPLVAQPGFKAFPLPKSLKICYAITKYNNQKIRKTLHSKRDRILI